MVVRGTGRLSLASSAALGRKARVEMSGSGKIVLADGVEQRVGALFVGGSQMSGGTWGSSASDADNKNDTLFEGRGVLKVAGTGMFLIFR